MWTPVLFTMKNIESKNVSTSHHTSSSKWHTPQEAWFTYPGKEEDIIITSFSSTLLSATYSIGAFT